MVNWCRCKDNRLTVLIELSMFLHLVYGSAQSSAELIVEVCRHVFSLHQVAGTT